VIIRVTIALKKLEKVEYTLTFSHIGFKAENKKLVVTSNDVMEVNISLRKSEIMFGEAVVTSTWCYCCS